MFQSLLLQVSFKTTSRRCRLIAAFQSLLLQVSFKTIEHITSPRARCFNPFSFRSPSKHGAFGDAGRIGVSIPSPSGLLQNLTDDNFSVPIIVSIPSPSGLLQNEIRVEMERIWGFNPFSFRSPSKRRGGTVDVPPRFNPFSFRSPSKPRPGGGPSGQGFQSLLLQVSFKTDDETQH